MRLSSYRGPGECFRCPHWAQKTSLPMTAIPRNITSDNLAPTAPGQANSTLHRHDKPSTCSRPTIFSPLWPACQALSCTSASSRPTNGSTIPTSAKAPATSSASARRKFSPTPMRCSARTAATTGRNSASGCCRLPNRSPCGTSKPRSSPATDARNTLMRLRGRLARRTARWSGPELFWTKPAPAKPSSNVSRKASCFTTPTTGSSCATATT